MNKKNNNVLVVAAHPDDEMLGCGAAMAKHAAQGDRVRILILGSGITARKDVTAASRRKLLNALRQSAERACRAVGAEQLIVKDFPDNKFDSVPLLDIVQTIEEVVGEFRPNVVYTHHSLDVNIDHQRVAGAMQAVARPMRGSSIDRILAFEVASATEWNFFRAPRFSPNVFVDVSGCIDKKMDAMKCYGSELREFPHPRSLEYLAALAKVRGGQSGLLAAEAFELVYERAL